MQQKKGTDQLHGYCAANMHPCFCIHVIVCKKQVFSCQTGLILYSLSSIIIEWSEIYLQGISHSQKAQSLVDKALESFLDLTMVLLYTL